MSDIELKVGDRVFVRRERVMTLVRIRNEHGHTVAYCEYSIGGYRCECRVAAAKLKRLLPARLST